MVSTSLFFFACKTDHKSDVSNSLFYEQATDAYIIIEFEGNGVFKRYNRHMGGKYETFGTWRQDDSKIFTKLDSTLGWLEHKYYSEKEIVECLIVDDMR